MKAFHRQQAIYRVEKTMLEAKGKASTSRGVANDYSKYSTIARGLWLGIVFSQIEDEIPSVSPPSSSKFARCDGFQPIGYPSHSEIDTVFISSPSGCQRKLLVAS